MPRKGQVFIKGLLIVGIALYLITVGILYGLVGQDIARYRPELASAFTCKTWSGSECSQYTVQPSTSNLGGVVAPIGFFDGIAVTFGANPWWLNTLVFAPLLFLLAWLVITSLIPTVPG
jgi:hypothetical protein